MYLGNCILVYIIVAVAYAIAMPIICRKRGRNLLWVGCCMLLALGIITYFDYFFIPFALDARGLDAIGDELIKIKYVYYMVPFSRYQDWIKHEEAISYFASFYKEIIAAVTIGLTCPLCFKRIRKWYIGFGVALIIACFPFVYYYGVKIFTGYFIRIMDIMEIFIFILMYLLGYAVFSIICHIHGELINNIDRIDNRIKRRNDENLSDQIL